MRGSAASATASAVRARADSRGRARGRSRFAATRPGEVQPEVVVEPDPDQAPAAADRERNRQAAAKQTSATGSPVRPVGDATSPVAGWRGVADRPPPDQRARPAASARCRPPRHPGEEPGDREERREARPRARARTSCPRPAPRISRAPDESDAAQISAAAKYVPIMRAANYVLKRCDAVPSLRQREPRRREVLRFLRIVGLRAPPSRPAGASPRQPEPEAAGPSPAAPAPIAGRYAVAQLPRPRRPQGGLRRARRAAGREVAVALFDTAGLGEAALARARREMHAMEKLGEHPHVVAVYDTGEDDGRPYIVSRYMAGGDVQRTAGRKRRGREARGRAGGRGSGSTSAGRSSTPMAAGSCTAT